MDVAENLVKVSKIDRLSPTKVKLMIEVKASMVESKEAAIVGKIQRQAKLPGFRPGKIPAQIVKQKYGSEIKQDLINELLETAMMNAVTETKLFPLDRPKINLKDVNLEKGQGFNFEAEFEVHPEIDLKDYKGLSLTEPPQTVEEKDVDAQIDRIRANFATMVPVEKKKPEAGLFAQLAIGVEIADMDPPKVEPVKEFSVELGAGQLIPDLEKQLLTLEVGEHKVLEAQFPEDYPEKDFAGKKGKFDCKILELKQKELPELTDEFAEQVKPKATVLSLKADIRKELEEMTRQQGLESLRGQVVEQLIEANSFELPQSMVDQSEKSLLESIHRQQHEQQAQGHSHDHDCNDLKLTDEEKELVKKRAADQVKSSLILGRIAELESIGVDNLKVAEKVKELAQRLNRSVEETEKVLSSKGMMDKLRDEVLTDSVFDFLIENAKIKKT